MFKDENGTLVIQRVDVPKLHMNVMQDQQDSYRKYMTDTIYKDMAYMEELLRDIQGLDSLSLKVRVGELVSQTFARTQVNKGKYYYPVIGTFYLQGKAVGSDLELLRIPYMDDYCKINVAGASKVVLCTQRLSEDISYTLKENLFNIAMPYANIRLYATKKSVKVAYGKYRVPADMLISAMLYECGDNRSIYDIFKNTFLLNTFKVSPHSLNEYVYSTVMKDYDIIKKYKSIQYELGSTRDALNESLTIDRAVGCILSRETLGYKPGTRITEDIISQFKRNRINEVYVQVDRIPEGYFYGDSNPLIISSIEAGWSNCAFLRKRLPKYAHIRKFDTTIQLSGTEAIIIAKGEPITNDMAEFLAMTGITEVYVTAGTSSKVIMYSFEREIAGNYTARLRELTDTIPDGRYADEWVYYYNNPNLDRVDDSHITAHDLVAVLSIIGQIMVTGESPLLNRDTSFLKKVMLINETFSETLRKAIASYVSKYSGVIPSKILSTTSDNVFFGLTKAWIKVLNSERILAPADTVNLSAEISQVCHIDTIINGHEAKEEMRYLAMPYYGRICPFETPAGKKLGLVNTKAIGAKIENGLLKTPYRKVLKTRNGIRISDKITYLSVKEEMGNKFGDMLSLVKDSNGNYVNTPILAKIPNPTISDEPFIYANINSFDLAGGYVEAFPEQFLSPTAALIPCAGADDAVRISYGLSQLRQSIYLPNSENPLVRTFMYEDMFDYSGVVTFISPCDGVVKRINNQEAIIQEDVTGNSHLVPIQNANTTGQLDMTVDVLAKPGQHVNDGEVIAEGYKYPQSFVVRAPFSGTIRDIRDNAIEIEKSDHMSEFVDLDTCDMIAFDNGRIMGQSAIFMNVEVSVGDYVKKGQIIATSAMSRNGIYSPSRNELCAYVFVGYNYEDGVCVSEQAAVNYTSLIAHSIDKTINKKHFPHASANPLQGFKYCGAGDVVGKITTQEDVSSSRYYEEYVKATSKCTGIPYEHTTLEDDKDRRVYRYHLLGFNKLKKGDKMTGRHGNKGVVSKVLPNSKVPMLKNGRIINVMLCPAGVPSRMNLGQIDEIHLSLIAKVLNYPIKSNSYNGATTEDIELLMNYAYDLANTVEIGELGGPYNRAAFDSVCAKYSSLPKFIHDHSWNNLDSILDWRDTFDRKGDAYLYDPETGTYLEYPVTIGYCYYNKQMQEADEKICYRSGPLDEQYSRTSSQPQKGDYSNNGQRTGEMEFVAWAAYGCASMIDELLNEKSDNIGARINTHMKQLNIPYRVPEAGCTSRAVENMIYMLEGMGVHLDVPREVANVSQGAINDKVTCNISKMIQRNYALKDNNTYKLKAPKMTEDFNDIADFFEQFGIK